MEKYNSQLKFVESYELSEDFAENQAVDVCAADSDGYLYDYEYSETGAPCFYVYDADYHKTGKIDSPESPDLFTAADGQVYVNYWENGAAHFGRMDRDDHKIEELDLHSGGYDLYGRT